MLRTLFAAATALCLLTVSGAEAQQIRLELEDYGAVSGRLDDCPLDVALLEVAKLGGVTVVFDPSDLRGLTVSAHLTGLDPRRALELLLSSQGLDCRELEGCLIVGPCSTEDRERLARRVEVLELAASIRELSEPEWDELPRDDELPLDDWDELPRDDELPLDDWDELPPEDDLPPGDWDEQPLAESLGPEDSTLGGYLEPGTEVHIELRVDEPGTIILDTEGSEFDTVLALYDEEWTQLAEDDDGGPSNNSSMMQLEFEPGLYYLGLRGYDAHSEGSYVCRMRRPVEPVGTLAPGQSFAWTVGDRQPVWVALFVHAAGHYSIDTEGSTFDTLLELYDPNQVLLAEDDDGGPGNTSRIVVRLEAGYYLVALRGFGGASGSLILRAQAAEEPEPPVPELRAELEVGGELTDVLGPGEDCWVSIQVHSESLVSIDTRGSQRPVWIALHDETGETQLWYSDGVGEGRAARILAVLEEGQYLLRVVRGRNDGQGSFRLSVTAE
jgi:hypothetical protein